MEQDTIRLLRECDAGVKMGISSIDDVIGRVKQSEFRKTLTSSKNEHEEMLEEISSQLCRMGDGGKEPNPMAKGMSWIKTNTKLGFDESDETVADLMTDGCNMGVKSLHRYLNQYKDADDRSKDITKRLINLEERLAIDIRSYL